MPTEVTKEELEQLNAQRIQLGLKPLDVEPSDSNNEAKAAPAEEYDEDAVAEANFSRVQDEARRERAQKALGERIAKAKNKRVLARRLVGRSLGEADQGQDDKPESTLAWLKASKKRAKENAARRLQQQLEEQEAQVQAEYGQDDLAGLRVGHELDDFEDGEERILTLKDARVLDDAEDELVDNLIAQRERDDENAERRKGAKKYTGLDDDEFDAGPASSSSASRLGKKRGILAKYDADLGEEDKLQASDDVGFRIGAPKKNKEEERQRQAEEAARLANRQLLNLDYSKNVEVSDYLTEGEVGFKKAKGKKKKRAATRVKVDLDDDDQSGIAPTATTGTDTPMVDADADASSQPAPRRREIETDNFVDDDELQASLAKARRSKAKKSLVKLTPEQIAVNLAAQKEEEEEQKARLANGHGSADANPMDVDGPVKTEDDGDDKALTFDSTTEFVRNLAFKAAAEEPRRPVKTEADASAGDEARVKTETSEAGPSSEVVRSIGKASTTSAAKERAPNEGEDMDMSDDEDLENLEVFAAPAHAGADASAKNEDEDESAEPQAGASMAATLALLRQQGLLQEYTPELREKEARQREYDLWLAEKRRRERLREEELAASKARGSAVDQATREYENQQRDVADAREAARRFANYKPDVEIKYHDQYGRELSAKKAWKLLSHRFHGKAPGHKKQELELRRLENERKREKMESGDTPSGMSKAFQDRSERTGQAHMVLSVGARGNAPQELTMLGPDLTKSARSAAAAAAGGSSHATSTKGGKGKTKAGPGGAASSSIHAAGSQRRAEVSAGITSIGLQSFVPRNVGGSGLASVVPAAKRNGATPLPPASNHHGEASPSSSSNPATSATTPTMMMRPAMKPAFAPISRSTVPGGASPSTMGGGGNVSNQPLNQSSAPTRTTTSGFKLQLGGAGAKRKAEEGPLGSREPDGKSTRRA